MSLSRMFFVCVFVLGLSLSGFSQARSSSPNSDNLPTTPPTTGKIEVGFTITILSALPSTDLIACSVSAIVEGETITFTETAIRAGVRNGGSATCYVPIPYSWLLQHPGSDSILLDFDVTVEGSGASPYPFRQSGQDGNVITPIPTNGTLTSIATNFVL